MNGGEPREGRREGNRTPAVDRRRYLRAIGAVGAAGALGAGATGSGTGQEGDGPAAPHGLRIEELGTDSVTLAWYHRAGYDGETTAESYEVRVDGEVVREVDAPAPTPIERDPLVTATVENLDPGTGYEIAVRAIDPDGATATASLATTTRDPSRIGEYEFDARTSETAFPTNWADVTTEDAAHRVLRIRGGIVPGGSCRVGTVHELAYDEDEDAFRVVLDAPRDGGPPCPPEVRELAYDFRVALDRAPQTVIVEHRSADWQQNVPLIGPQGDQILSVASERGRTPIDSEAEVTVGFDTWTTPDDLVGDIDGFTLELTVADPSVAELTGLSSDHTDLNDEVWIADDGSRLRWEGTEVPDARSARRIRPLATASVAGTAAGTTAVTAALDLHTEAVDRTLRKASADGRIRVVDPDDYQEYGRVFPVDRGERSLTVGWEDHARDGVEYEISVDGTTESVIPAEETEVVHPEGGYGEYRGATVDGLDPDTAYRIEVDGVGPDGERESFGHKSIRTLDGTTVRHTAFQLTDWNVGTDSEWGTISVDDDRTRVEATGALYFGSVPQTLYLQEVTHEADGVLRLSVGPTSGGGDEAIQVLGFELGVDLDRPVERVVLEYPTRDWKRVWDPTLGGDYERLDLQVADDSIQRGERTELSLSLDAPYPGAHYLCRVFVDDRSVASVVDVSRPAWSDDADPDHYDGGFQMEVDVDTDDVDPTQPVDVGTAVLEGRDGGTTSFGYLVKERVGDERPVNMGGRFDPVLAVEDGPAGPPAIAERRPTDPDDDGLYEDVNGDGATNIADAGDLFQHREDDAIRNHVEHYDFSGNDEVDLADVVDLFRENTD